MLFVDHQTTAKLQKREQNMTVLLENNVPVLLAKSVCDLCPLLRTRTFGTFSLVLLDFFSNFQRKTEKSLKVATPTFFFHVHQSGNTDSIKASQRQSQNTSVWEGGTLRVPVSQRCPATDEEERILEKA
ncbi:uncharacterized protein TNCV_2041811 [Trichonephila clavipes]|nr:uncharacterized protein TNCV_2041811 [Trichonephila clavipes]